MRKSLIIAGLLVFLCTQLISAPGFAEKIAAINIDHSWAQWQSAENRWNAMHKQNPDPVPSIETINSLVQESDKAKSSGYSYEVRNKLEQALKLNADHIFLWIKYGDASQDRGGDEEGVDSYLIAEAMHPDKQQQLAIYRGLVKSFEKIGDPAKTQLEIALKKLLALGPDADMQLKLDYLQGKILNISGFETRNDSDIPEACYTFSWPVRDDGSTNYEDFISVEPAVKLAAIPSKNQICLRGFTYGKTYDVTLKSGFPARGEAKLIKLDKRSVSFDNRKPHLAFQNNAYIVPRMNSLGVPLRGVNVDVAKVEILQVNDRNLISQFIDNRVMDGNSTYDIDHVREDAGRSLWEGFMNLKRVDNKTTITAIPFNDLVKNPVPGLYAIMAQPAEREDKTSAKNLKYKAMGNSEAVVQWLVVTDTGLTSYEGQDGIHLAVRSYNTGKPLSGIKLRLLSRDNTILSDVVSDRNGHATFADALLQGKGGKASKMVQAFGQSGDFTFMDLQQPALDLSENNIEGRNAPKKMDAFIYSERGIYRPGDTMHLSALLRNIEGDALKNAPPLTFKVLRPDGVMFTKLLVKPHDTNLGGYHTEVTIPENARMGIWSVEVYSDPTEPSLGSYNLQVEDFVPARIEVKMTVPENAMLSKEISLSVPVQADYLYGAPVSKSGGDASLDLRMVTETPFKDYTDYQFGLMEDNVTSRHVELTLPQTDDKGASMLTVSLKDIPSTTKPLEALVHASVFDDTGRAVNRTAIIPVTRKEPFLGLKEAGGSETEQGWNFAADRQLSLVAVDRNGKPVTQSGLRYRLVREEYRYDWYSSSNQRNYRAQVYDIPVTTGTTEVKDKPATLSFSGLDYGTYRLEVTDPSQNQERLTAASIHFNVGWTERSMTAKDKPDSIQLRLDQKNYHRGDTAKLFIKAPFEGEAELVIARENILEQRTMHLPKEGTTVKIAVGDNWGPGVYALVHAYRPGEKVVAGSKTPAMAPGRAVGAIWAGMDPKPRTLEISMELPEVTKPKQKLTVPVQVTGANAGQAEITISAVDEGILQLTDFKTPDAEKYIYAKRRLGMELRDSYGRLLDPNLDEVGQIRSGGDQSGRSAPNLPSKWIKPFALFSGPVMLDKNGKAEITFDLPEFNGKVRLMAMAYSTNSLGHAEQDMIVRDKVVINLGLPRFLAPKDKAELMLNLDNVDGPAGKAKLDFVTTGGIKIGDYSKEVELKTKQKQQVKFNLTAEELGDASLKMVLTLPDGTPREQNWDLTVRPTQTYQTTFQKGILESGKSVVIDKTLLKDVLTDKAIISASFGTVPDLQLSRVIQELDRYPYGCLEQTSSRLLPLLYLSDVLKQSGIKDKKEAPEKEKINEAINHILSMQRGDGSFSLWNGYGDREEYLSLYAIDVLQRAQSQGYDVPEYALTNALNWLHDEVKSGEFETPILHRRAYGYYLLAKAGLIEPGQVRYFAERYGHNLTGVQAPAFLAAALTQIGDTGQAAPYWKQALQTISQSDAIVKDYNSVDYGSYLRDNLIALTLAAEAGQEVKDPADHVNGIIARTDYLSTQDEGWAILASHALYKNSKAVKLSLSGQPIDAEAGGPVVRNWYKAQFPELETKQEFRNDGDTSINYTIAVNAIPKEQKPPVSEGFTIQRKFYNRSGKEIDPKDIKQNDMVIVVVDGDISDKRITEQSLLVDLLPAGLELESSQFGKGQNVGDFAWIGSLTKGTYQELRDDRFIAAFNSVKPNEDKPAQTDSDSSEGDGDSPMMSVPDGQSHANEPKPLPENHFRFAYAVRAVTKGEFVLPATSVDAMYQPQYHALGQAATITVK